MCIIDSERKEKCSRLALGVGKMKEIMMAYFMVTFKIGLKNWPVGLKLCVYAD